MPTHPAAPAYTHPETVLDHLGVRFVEGDGTDTPGSGDGAPTDTPTGGGAGGDGGKGGDGSDDVANDPEKARALLKSLRSENAKSRVRLKEYDALLESQKSDTQKAVDAARAEGEKTATVKAMDRLVRADLRAALTGVVDNPQDVIDDLDTSKYLTDDGDVDDDKVKALIAKWERIAGPRRRGAAVVGAGRVNPGASGKQSTREQFAGLFQD